MSNSKLYLAPSDPSDQPTEEQAALKLVGFAFEEISEDTSLDSTRVNLARQLWLHFDREVPEKNDPELERIAATAERIGRGGWYNEKVVAVPIEATRAAVLGLLDVLIEDRSRSPRVPDGSVSRYGTVISAATSRNPRHILG